MPPLLEIRNLHTYFATREGVVKAVNGVSLSLEADSVLGVMGESGSGKTMTALSVMRLVPFPGKVVSGEILYDGRDLLRLPDDEMRRIRGQEISLVFQDASSALNPVITVGKQVEELMIEHTSVSKRQARDIAVDLLSNMGIPDARDMLNRYPFQLSGGMAQRVMMAIGVALRPKVLIADEPTSNLDVTLQAEILQRMRELRQESKTAIMLVTHDLGVIAQMAEKVAVIYGGYVVEFADTATLYRRPDAPVHVGPVPVGAQARRGGPETSANDGRAAADAGPAGPVSVPASLREGHGGVPHESEAATGRGGGGAYTSVL